MCQMFFDVCFDYPYMDSEAATETIFQDIPAAPFSILRSFQEALCVHQTDTNLPGGYVCLPNR